MGRVFIFVVALLGVFNFAYAEVLKVEPNQCHFSAEEKGIKYQGTLQNVKRNYCWMACEPGEKGTTYQSLQAHPNRKVSYFTTFTPRKIEGEVQLHMTFERYIGADFQVNGNDEKKIVDARISMTKTPGLWKASVSFDGKKRVDQEIKTNDDGTLSFKHHIGNGVTGTLKCDVSAYDGSKKNQQQPQEKTDEATEVKP